MRPLEVADLSVSYGSFRAVERVSFSIAAGSVMGLVGESGSGKSTVARAIMGLIPSQGRVTVGEDGATPGDRRQRRRRRARGAQLIFQDPISSLDPRFTVGDCIAEALPAQGRRTMNARIGELLEMVALDPGIIDQRPQRLSGGQQQRVAIARALATDPDVLIADEVTASLDVSVQAVVLNLLRSIQRDLGLTMLFISHNLAVVRYISNTLGVMYRGRIVEYGSVREVIENPQHPYTRALLEAVPRIGGGRLESSGPWDMIGEPSELPPQGGCPFRARCPVGPEVHAEREICRTTDPSIDAAERAHHASCHFAEVATAAV